MPFFRHNSSANWQPNYSHLPSRFYILTTKL